jgi:hypothetical protein
MFLDGAAPIGTGALSGGQASFTTSALAVGSHTITASYGGDGNFNESTGSLTGNPQVVKAETSTAVSLTGNPQMVVAPLIPPMLPPPPRRPPVLSGFTAVHRCVTSAVLEHAHAGSLAFSFTLSEAAKVTFAVLHRVGSPAWTKCPRVRGHTPSTYRSVGEVGPLVPVGRQTDSLGTAARARPLATVVRLTPGRHRISLAQIGVKRLPPGTYVVSAKAVNSAGQSSGVEYAKFWVFS